MKKLSIYVITCLVAVFGFTAANAQSSCSATAPTVTSGTSSYAIGGGVWSTAPVLSVNASAELPNVEYLITLQGTVALDGSGQPDTTGGGGDVIMGTSMSGVFHPGDMGRYGIAVSGGDTLDITAVGYNLGQVKALADALLNGEISPGNPCCNIFSLIPGAEGFCDSVNNAGIFGANDINNVGDVLVIFDALSEAQLSIESLIANMALVNSYQSTIPANCGNTNGNLPVCYGVASSERYSWPVATAVAVENLGDVATFFMFPNPATTGIVNLNINTTKSTDLAVNVYSVLGEQVHSQNLGSINGQTALTISTADLTAGMYFVELTDGQNKEVRKLMVK